jgi:hypothetical protein
MVHTPVVILTDLTHVRAALLDSMISRLETGARATVRAAAWPGRTFTGRSSRSTFRWIQ